MLSVGDLLVDRYRISGLIAAGGMGEVYLARRVLLNDEVAIKVLRRDPGVDPSELADRFMNEARLCAALRHPNIVGILDFNVDGQGQPFLVMEHLNGPSLRDEIAAHGRLPADRVAAIVGSIAGALDVAHSRRIVHRDLKPANIVSHRFDSGDIVYKVIDFGIANIRANPDDATRTNRVERDMATLAYASPEQLAGAEVDARSDVYSLGVVAFEMLAGRPVFASRDPAAIISGHLAVPAPPLRTIVADVPQRIEAAVARALEKRPSDRWQSAGDFGRALLPSDARPVEADSRSGLQSTYELGALMGRGRMGSEIYTGTHRAMAYPVAIRVLRRESTPDWEAARSRFLTEARSMQLSHPSILQVRDFGDAGDYIYVVTDVVTGASLRETLDRECRIPWSRVQPLALGLIDATGALHRRGALTFGLTPETIRVTADADGERLLVSSAGASQLRDLLAGVSEDALRGGTLTESALYYVAPEVLVGGAPDARADIYTTGAVAYEMITGRRPFDAPTLPALVAATLTTRPADPRSLAAGIPDRAAQCLLRCLAAKPDERFAGAAALAAEWRAI